MLVRTVLTGVLSKTSLSGSKNMLAPESLTVTSFFSIIFLNFHRNKFDTPVQSGRIVLATQVAVISF